MEKRISGMEGSPSWKSLLEKQQYRVIGEHTAVKICHWLKESLVRGRTCYKNRFYGIASHRCLQMTPSLNNCNQKCLFCWRVQEWNPREVHLSGEEEDIGELVEKCIVSQRELISGYKGNPNTDMSLWEEAQHPKHAAISLTGEPMLYPRLGELIEEFQRRDMTTFLVTNGTVPNHLKRLHPLPTQLYISVDAPNEAVFSKLCSPLYPNLWKQHLLSLDVLKALSGKTRTVVRHTLVKGWNMSPEHIPQYGELVLKGSPEFLEVKAYVFVGDSRQRMSIRNMPSHEEIRSFARGLAQVTGYRIVDEHLPSRVVLLMREDVDENHRFIFS